MFDNEDKYKEGYIRLWRSFLNWEWYTDSATKILFLHCLLKANHSDKEWRGIKIKRGQFLTSFEKLSNETGLSVRQVRTAILHLETTREVTRYATGKNTVITVKNYDAYQASDKQNDKQTTSKRQGSDKVATTTNNEKNEKNNNSSCSSSCILEEEKKQQPSTSSNNDISDLNPDRIRDLKNFYGEYSNVHLNSRQYDSLQTMILNDNTFNILINQLSEKIETGKEKLYDEKTPAMHYIRLKKYWEYYQNKAGETKDEKPPDYRPEWVKVRDKKLKNAFAYLDELAAQDEKMKENKK